MKKLSPEVARTDLTDRECTKILGGLIGGLCNLAPIENVRNAVRWWAERDEPWAAIEQATKLMRDGGQQ